jgi:hypothetical protein
VSWKAEPLPGGEAPPFASFAARRVGEPVPHWQFATVGLVDLGYELSVRVAADGDAPPLWPKNLVRFLGAYVRGTEPIAPDHVLVLPAGMLDEVAPSTAAVVLREDPRRLAGGRVLQVLPLTADEWRLLGRWSAAGVYAAIEAAEPGFVWRADRRSILAGDAGADLARRAEAEGSAVERTVWDELTWGPAGVRLDAYARANVETILRARVAYGRPAVVVCGERTLRFAAGPLGRDLREKEAVLTLPADRADELADALVAAAAESTVALDGVGFFAVGALEALPVIYGD